MAAALWARRPRDQRANLQPARRAPRVRKADVSRSRVLAFSRRARRHPCTAAASFCRRTGAPPRELPQSGGHITAHGSRSLHHRARDVRIRHPDAHSARPRRFGYIVSRFRHPCTSQSRGGSGVWAHSAHRTKR